MPISARLMPGTSLLCAVETKNDRAPVPAQEVVPMQEMVAYLCDGLPVSVVADIIGVERKTVYSWLDGVAPREFLAARVEAIFHILSENKTNLKSLHRVLNRAITGGPSIRQLLSEKIPNERAIKEALIALESAMALHTERDAARRPAPAGAHNPLIDEMPVAGPSD
jgi:hypothetical protein